ncbi:hypothetical protein QE360_000631 [Sphingomonas sp. SORGH_AS789]|nr:hypothetical protein [Sphingomonas sp. SORGH_AS_0789]MDR6148978.1 hypothetical protein [Sphingomonas sp. SORGH_AS_0742]
MALAIEIGVSWMVGSVVFGCAIARMIPTTR